MGRPQGMEVMSSYYCNNLDEDGASLTRVLVVDVLRCGCVL